MPTQPTRVSRKEGVNVIYEVTDKGEVPVAIIIRDNQSRHAVIYEVKELAADEIMVLVSPIIKTVENK